MSSFKQEFAEEYPFLWHFTAAEHIDRMKRMDCAATLLRAAGCDKLIRERRKFSLTLCVNGEKVTLRDQHESLEKVKLPSDSGWSLADYIEYLNGFVFFFPGGKDGRPIKESEGFVKKYYCGKQQQALCIPTKELFMANQGTPPQFSSYNSGAFSLNIPRGPNTFVCGEKFKGNPPKVVEVVFRCGAKLPTMVCYWSVASIIS